ncbi:interleukin-1 receptor type 1 [Microcaecilia unicolor]|uniref:Interleukin-1 receptor type 1-like n=1 Tax=Microcaecilia unicolor TaxID=1415580 RepID=A0A6P7XIU2_9AMPH|nr:interleukin-1 receptor type 1-like [Microcaecilia unicolor]
MNCSKKSVQLIIYKNDDGLCYNKEHSYPQIVIIPNDKIVCKGISHFKGKNVKIKWYKDCKPLTDSRFQPVEFNLVATNLTLGDKGFYTCEISYEYDGKIYNISNTIRMTVKVVTPEPPVVIIYPTNGSIEAELESHLSLPCKVSCSNCDVNWWVNGTLPDFYSSRYTQGADYIDTVLDGTRIRTKYLNITEVKNEDYDQIFMCLAKSSRMHSRVFVSLKPPDTKVQRYLIGIFVALGLVIILTAVTCKIFKIEIVLCYRKHCLPLTCKGVPDGKLYDGYVIYPKSNKPIMVQVNIFVLKMLPEVLEKQCGYQLFICGRDELPGEAKANLIDETIKQSRRVIIILINKESGDNLFEDAFEQHVALYNALIHNKDKVILIEVEKIKDYMNMPESIKYIKEKWGAIRWKGDVTDRAFSPNTKFWKNVRYWMPQIPSSR